MNSISYIIPHYDNIKGIKRLLNSIDLHNNDEVIIVDDCSENKIYQEVLKLKSTNVRVFSTIKNGGAGKARNIGLELAKNTWVLFADADDYFLDGYYKQLVSFLEKDKLDIVYFTPTSIKENPNSSVRGNRHEYYEYLVKNYDGKSIEKLNNLQFKMVVPWSKLIKKEFLSSNNINFDEVMVSNDVMFSARIGLHSQHVLKSNYPIYCCSENDKSMTSDVGFKKIQLRLKEFIKYYKYLESNLSYKEFEDLNLTGASFMLLAFRNKFKICEIKAIYQIIKHANIPVINCKYVFETLKRLVIS